MMESRSTIRNCPKLAATCSCTLLLASLLLTCAVSAQTPQPLPASPSEVRLPLSSREWQLRVPLDSGEVLVEVTSRAAAVTVVAPTGTFLQAFANSLPLADWADRAAGLQTPGAPSDLVRGGSNPTVFTLARAAGDSSSGYVLTGTNGAWDFAITIAPSQVGPLFGALRGDTTAGALAYDYPRTGKTRHEDAPHVSGAWFSHQVDRKVRLGPRPPRPVYPSVLLGSRTAGTVRLMFTVDSTGSVVPSSIRLLGSPHPMLARAARDALLSARFAPAERDRRPVAQITMQDFTFEGQ